MSDGMSKERRCVVIAHIQKFTRNAVGHLCKHFERGTDSHGEPIRYGNENIDLSKSHLNYNLAPERDSQYLFIKNRCDEVYCLNRKDVNVLCSCCVTAPKDLPESEHRKFFEATFDFLSKRYGIENVVSAYVHMDETSPHLHFAFVPVCYDQQRERYTVSAKKVVTKNDLKTLHPDMERFVSDALGHHVGIMTGELSDRPDLTLPQYRTMKETEARLNELQQQFVVVRDSIEKIEHQLLSVRMEYEAKKRFVNSFEITQEAVYDGVTEHNRFGKKTVEMSPEKYQAQAVSYSDKIATLDMKEETERLIEEIQNSDLSKKYHDLLKRSMSIRDHAVELERTYNNVYAELQHMKHVLKVSPELKKKFEATEQALQSIQERQRERDIDYDEPCR